ncbi:kunitz-like toxin PcKuz3 [Drosophila bipectinata]|uniref:kunitz-like toxin PcKuz3 n=1 Tax=Drosophila bipectinata TaxID=42026 RepID=UPI001C8A8899|nr:male accessory gland serine protease inhibitor-like [Drosophila bipectinata]
MKVLIFLAAIFALLGTSLALKNEICGLPHSRNGDLISCEAYIPSWTYNSSSNECIKFIYGGCRGNDNRFDTKQACEEKCLE